MHQEMKQEQNDLFDVNKSLRQYFQFDSQI